MTVSHLTSSDSFLRAGIVSFFVEEGYPFDTDTTNFDQYLITVLTGLGGTGSNLTMSTTQLMAALVNEISGTSVSDLTTSYSELLAMLYNAAESGIDPLALGTVTWASNSTDATPNFSFNLPAAATEGNDLVAEYSIAGADTWSNYFTHTLTSQNIIDDAITISGITPLSDATYDFRFRLEDGATLGSWSIVTDVVIDATAPTISTVALTSSAGADNTYIAGNVVQATVTFDEAVIVTGTPQLTLTVGASAKTADYASGSGTTALVFSYTIVGGDTDANGISIGANALALNGGTIRDAAGNNATITHSSVADAAAHKVDTTGPSAPTLSPLDNATGVLVGANLTATFAEDIAFHTTVSITIKKTSDNSTIHTFTEADIGGAISIAGAVLTINPGSDLANSTEYYVQIGSTSIKDLAGNFYAGISSTTAWSFTTASSGVTFTSVTFDSGDYMNRGANITGFADGEEFTFVIRFRPVDAVATRFIVQDQQDNFKLVLSSANQLDGYMWGAAERIDFVTTTTFENADGMMTLFVAGKTTSGQTALKVYKNDTAAGFASGPTLTAGTFDLTPTDWKLFASAAAASPLACDVEFVWFDNVYYDIAVQGVRDAWLAANIGADGSGPGAQPKVFLMGDAAAWNSDTLNLGTGGGFTMNGTVV